MNEKKQNVNKPKDKAHLEQSSRGPSSLYVAVKKFLEASEGDASGVYNIFFEEFEMQVLLAALDYSDGKLSKASKILGIKPSLLSEKIDYYGLR